ncbi:MFS transporter [Ktedonobacteria bacterium brp13]|nr:MFS transporter [Ktedonobacteria bacterium brp13]
MSTIPRVNKLITLMVTCLGSFMVLLDASIVVTALPTIQNHFHATLLDLQWVVDAFTLALAALMLTGGTLGDRFGRKRFFLLGLVLFLIGSVFCGFAPALGWLLFGRVVQGIGAAALAPGSLSVLASAFPEPRERTRAIGIWASVSGLGLAIGPLAGGWLIGIANWPAIFFVNLPVGLLTLVLSILKLPESRNPNARRIDLPGQVLVTGTLFCLVMALIEGSSVGWTSPLILGLFIGSTVCLLAFLFVEARVPEPMVPLRLFANSVFSVANVASVILGFAMMGSLFFLVQFLQNVQGYSAFETGLRTLPASVGIFAIAPFVGRLTARIGPRLPIILGALLGTTALFLLATTLQPDTSYVTLGWQIALFGIGCGFMMTPLTAAVLSATPQERSGLGSSLLNTSRQVGITLGVAILGAFVVQQYPGNIASQLTQRNLPASVSATIAEKIATAGAGVSQGPQSEHLPLPTAVLQQATRQAFVNTLHGAFLIAAIGLFAATLLVTFLLQVAQPATRTRAASVGSHEVTEALTTQDIVDVEISR